MADVNSPRLTSRPCSVCGLLQVELSGVTYCELCDEAGLHGWEDALGRQWVREKLRESTARMEALYEEVVRRYAEKHGIDLERARRRLAGKYAQERKCKG